MAPFRRAALWHPHTSGNGDRALAAQAEPSAGLAEQTPSVRPNPVRSTRSGLPILEIAFSKSSGFHHAVHRAPLPPWRREACRPRTSRPRKRHDRSEQELVKLPDPRPKTLAKGMVYRKAPRFRRWMTRRDPAIAQTAKAYPKATLTYRIVASRNALTSDAHTAMPSRREPNPQ